ncbi:MAG: tetratricopeptide repeat protein [Nitrospirae bacterium]|nr:tetratricopeptide repeat protein [Nitrospirota bacterium]
MLKKYKTLLKNPIIHILIIAAACVIVYCNSFKAPFMFDDYTNIIEKNVVRDIGDVTSKAPRWWLNNYLLIIPTANRRFVAILTFAMNYKLHGMDVVGFHVFNLIVHMCNAMFIYLLVRLIFRSPFFTSSGFGAGVMALFTALLFAVHPIQTSAVTYIAQRYTSLATLFCLISIVAYVSSRLTASRAARYMLYATSVFSAILAMRSKEIAFTLPVIAAVLEFMFFGGKLKKRILYLLPLMSTMLIIPMSILSEKYATAASALNTAVSSADSSMKAAVVALLTPPEYLFTQFRVIVTYLRLLFVPVGLNLDYDYPVFRSFFSPEVALSFLVVAAVFASSVYMFYRSAVLPEDNRDRYAARLYSFGILWFFIALSVESSVLPIKDVINEYRLYYPSVGFFIALMAVAMWLSEKKAGPMKVVPALAVIVVLLSAMTLQRNEVWADRIKLWEDTVRKSPNKARPHYNLGYDYLRHGRIPDAIREFQTAVTLRPDYAEPYNNLGDIYASQGRMDEAFDAFKKAIQYSPDFAVAYNNLGTIYDERGQFDEARTNYQTAIKLIPEYIDARLNLGNLYIKMNRLQDAVSEFRDILKFEPYNDEANSKLRALQGRGN